MAHKMEKEKTIVDSFSPATKYEAMLAELGGLGSGPTEDKTLLVFQVLDKILPHLGVFVKVMQMCRDELFDAVFSDQYTGSKEKQLNRYIQRIPFFTLVKRVYDERDERNDQLADQLDVVKKRLFDKQKQYENATETVEDLRSDITRLDEVIVSLEQEVTDRKEDIKELEVSLQNVKDAADKMEYHLTGDINDLQDDLTEAKNEANYLRQYKMGYDELQSAFQETPRYEEFTPRKKKRAAIATKRAHLVSSIDNSLKLEDQLLSVQNATLEEFDKFLEEHKEMLGEKVAEDGGSEDRVYEIHDTDIEQADQQLMVMQEKFQKSVADISSELSLLRQHKVMLQEQLQILEENKPALKRKKKSRQGSRPQTQESSMSTGFDEETLGDEEDTGMDPFIVQERVFSKYAAMFYTSDNNGKTFHEFKDAKYCPSCGEKTVMCPHKILRGEHAFPLPLNSTHIKVARPKVRINTDMMEMMFRPPTETDTLAGLSSAGAGKRIHSRVSVAAGVSPYMASKSPGDSITSTDTSAIGGGGLGDGTHFTHSIYRLWEDYKQRTDLERAVPRPLSSNRALSLMEQFSAYMLMLDEFNTENDQIQSVLDSLYSFLFDRYQKPEIAYLAAHDLMITLADNSSSNKLVWLFAQILIGNLDGAVLRYLLLMGDFINEVKWQEVEDFRAFAEVVYPFLAEDDLETLQMGYTSFSENKINNNLVAEYIVYTIMKYREPRFLEMENKLLNTPGKELNFMTEAEFIESSDAVLGVVNDKLRKRLYQEAFAYVSTKDGMMEGVPTLRLAQITSYLSLLSIAPVVKDEVGDRVEDAREDLPSPSTKPGINRVTFDTSISYKLLTMTDAKTLCHNIARRNMCRKLRMRSMDEY